jgi:hypothetical protein
MGIHKYAELEMFCFRGGSVICGGEPPGIRCFLG